MTDRTIVVVGASLAGFRAAEELRANGFDGRLVVVGEEPHQPYDRPPLSKAVLAGRREPADIGLTLPDPALDLAVEWELGVRATRLDVADRRLSLGDGRTITYDGCVVATGAVPRRLPGWGERRGLHVLRTLEDCLALRADLDASPGRVVVVGAGFIGAEVAATARERGLEVTMIEPLAAPVVRALGKRIGGFVADVHRDHGVDVRLGVGVEALAGDEREVAGVSLSDGSSIAADVVVVGVGVRPATDWLDGSGLSLDDGVVCDATCLAAPGVVAAGDLARWPLDGPGTPSVRIEHWDNAVGQGAHAARTLLADLAGGRGEPFAPVPWFWSDQYDRKFQLAGRASADCEVEIVAGSEADRRFTALYGRAGMLVAVLGVNMPAQVAKWRNRLAEGAMPFEQAVAEARG